MEKTIFRGQILPSKDGNEVYFLDELNFISWGLEYHDIVKEFAGKKVVVTIAEVEEDTNVQSD